VKQQDQSTGLQSDGSTMLEQNPNSSRFFSEEIPNTPFTAVMQEDDWMICWGTWRLSDILKSKEELYNYLETKKWMVMCAYTVALLQAARRYDRLGEPTPEETEIQAQVERDLLELERAILQPK